jgi:prepilin peptidase CpaA
VELLLIAAVIGAAVLVLGSAVSDAATMTIPNRIPVGLSLLFIVAAIAGPLEPVAIAWHVGTGLAVFLVCVGLFAAGVFGGGDAKLLPAIALWMGPTAVLPFVTYTAAFGGALAFAFLLARRVPAPATAPTWVARLMAPANGIPYGIAIAAGAFLAAKFSPLASAALS